MTHLADHNDGYRFLLTVIDVFSKYAWTMPLKRKDARSVAEAFDNIFIERKPQKLQTDKGKEFVNSTFQKKLEELGVQFYVSQNEDIKASVAERFNRTLKTKMWKYFTHRNTFKYTDVLQDLMYSYNHSYHRTIGRTPASVKPEDVSIIKERMYGTSEKSPVPKLKIGTKVRISKSRRPFDKGYLPNWTEEIFTIVDAIRTSPPTYKLEDYSKEKLDGSFYDYELQRVVKTSEVYKIEKIVKTRRKGGAKEYFVKWRGYPDKFSSWVKEIDMTNVI
jgi:hypothetical protein